MANRLFFENLNRLTYEIWLFSETIFIFDLGCSLFCSGDRHGQVENASLVPRLFWLTEFWALLSI